MSQTLAQLSINLGISLPVLIFLIVVLGIIIIWEGIWKLIGMWKAARRGSVIWFIVLAFINSVGILPILYIYIFSERKSKDKNRKR
jgi:hypothetical protein